MDTHEVEDLNFLLRGELSAVEAYTQALKTVESSETSRVLEECRESHATRSEKLRSAITELGGVPMESGGAWGGFAKFMTEGAAALGDKGTLAALEEGEDIGSNDYEWRLVKMHGKYRQLVKEELGPEQERTHKKLIGLFH
ncbi:MAG: PA2169 family four-helix-bundle protein [Candidatus Obscuribacterales bacterium]|nr:PA2169 family four-helix-bundle protein [Candidatus Obscuribacterales bacterium]